MEHIKETAFDWTSRDERGYWTSNEAHIIRRIKRYAEERPDDVTILVYPEKNGGYILASAPKPWMSVKPPRKVTLSEKQREAMAKNLKNRREYKFSHDAREPLESSVDIEAADAEKQTGDDLQGNEP
jgi:hypothetical protein